MDRSFSAPLLFFILLVFPLGIHAQDSVTYIRSGERLTLENPWRFSQNSAGNVYSDFMPDGVFTLHSGFQSGDLNLSQSSPDERDYSFSAHKSIRVKNIVFDGGVSYRNQEQDEVGWTARMNPHSGNPYTLADSIFGVYKKDYVNMYGAFGYQVNQKVSVGLNVDYMVGDGARIKDPRPVNDLFALHVFPSVIYDLGNLKLGANMLLMKGREKVSYTTIENSATYRFFRFLGLGKGAKAVNAWSYSRNYYSSGIGGELQAHYQTKKLNVFSGLGFSRTKEVGEDGSSNPRKDALGDYIKQSYNFYSILSFKNNLIHQIALFVDLSTGEGIEFLQEPYIEEGITYYRTIAEVSKFSDLQLSPRINYVVAKPYSAYLNKWRVQAAIGMDHFSKEYLLEADQSISNLIPSLDLNYSLLKKKKQLKIGVHGSYTYNLNQELKQLRSYVASQEIDAWQHVVYPDHLILSANSITIGADIRFGRAVKFLKEKTSQVFVELSGMHKQANHEAWPDSKSMQFLSLKLGITY